MKKEEDELKKKKKELSNKAKVGFPLEFDTYIEYSERGRPSSLYIYLSQSVHKLR